VKFKSAQNLINFCRSIVIIVSPYVTGCSAPGYSAPMLGPAWKFPHDQRPSNFRCKCWRNRQFNIAGNTHATKFQLIQLSFSRTTFLRSLRLLILETLPWARAHGKGFFREGRRR